MRAASSRLRRERSCRVILPEDAVVSAALEPGERDPNRPDRCGPERHDDPRCRPEDRGPDRRRARRSPHPRLERAARRLRNTSLRGRHGGGGEEGCRTDPSRQAAQRRRRRRHRGRARRSRGDRRALLRLDRRRRLPRMAGRPRAARRRGACPQEMPDESLGCHEPKHPFGRPRRADRTRPFD